MMIKRKNKPADGEPETLNTETTDNKENTSIPTDQNVSTSEDSGPGKSQQSSTDSKTVEIQATDKVEKELKETVAKLAEMQDKYIRLSAEFDNYRKRTLREKIDLSKYAEENMLQKIFPLMDDFERALLHMEEATDCTAMKSGIDLIYNKFNDFLKQNGVKEIEALNSSFNVDIHEAVAKIPVNEEDKKGKVVDVVLKGYYLQDKVLRFSKVVVGE